MRKHILYLASGSSRRFGENKLLYPIGGKPMYQHGLEILRRTAEDRQDCTVTVVSRYEAIRQTAVSMGFAAVDSPDSEKGISYTIRAGIDALPVTEQDDYLVFMVADQPYLRYESLEKLLNLANGEILCASMCCEGRPGNPTLFSASLIQELVALEGDTGGRAVLKKHRCVFVSANSPKELEDIDVPK